MKITFTSDFYFFKSLPIAILLIADNFVVGIY